MSVDKEIGTDPKMIFVITKEGHWLIDQGCYEEAAIEFLKCLPLERDPLKRKTSLKELGYCYLRLGWFEDAVKIYKELLESYPHYADIRFYLASAYASLKWTDEAIAELKTILRSDPTDVLARHDLGLCFRDKGWLRESLEEMRKANEYAATYGNAEEKEIVKSSLGHIEEEIQEGDEDGTKEAFLLLILLATVLKRSRVETGKPRRKH
ncbi:MAG: tetratricopeptide repeat protein [Syntrophaceae bacterium]|nr:tetratricopeptide repeat protein [Syntrophaceae bacterium]